MTTPVTTPSAPSLQEQLIATYGAKLVSQVARNLGDIYERSYREARCRICGRTFIPKTFRGNTNFALVSHGKMHARKDEAFQLYDGGIDGWRIMPTPEQLDRAKAEEEQAKSIAAQATELGLQLKPLFQQRRKALQERVNAEARLLDFVRENGVAAFQIDEARDAAQQVEEHYAMAQNITDAINAIAAPYPVEAERIATRNLNFNLNLNL